MSLMNLLLRQKISGIGGSPQAAPLNTPIPIAPRTAPLSTMPIAPSASPVGPMPIQSNSMPTAGPLAGSNNLSLFQNLLRNSNRFGGLRGTAKPGIGGIY